LHTLALKSLAKMPWFLTGPYTGKLQPIENLGIFHKNAVGPKIASYSKWSFNRKEKFMRKSAFLFVVSSSLALALIVLFSNCADVPQLTDLQQSNLAAGQNVKLLPAANGSNVLVDLNNDGVPDGTLVDSTGSGHYDGIDTNNDGIADMPIVDTDGDGIPDGIDSNNDGVPDATIVYDAPIGSGSPTPSPTVAPPGPGHCTTHPINVDKIQACNQNTHKALICQVPPGNPANEHTICIGAPAVKAHLAKGSYLGRCNSDHNDGSNPDPELAE
jgi:hypothetical protein